MLGAIVIGEIIIEGLLLGEDFCSMVYCFWVMGVEISELNLEKIIVQGWGLGQLQEFSIVLDVGNFGIIMCLMLGLLVG